MSKPTITTRQADAIAEEAMHAAFSVLAQHLDPGFKHDLGAWFAVNTERQSDAVKESLRQSLLGAAQAMHTHGIDTPNV
jgi:hypothetical protein